MTVFDPFVIVFFKFHNRKSLNYRSEIIVSLSRASVFVSSLGQRNRAEKAQRGFNTYTEVTVHRKHCFTTCFLQSF